MDSECSRPAGIAFLMSSITITYTVYPPTETVLPDELPTSRTIEVAVNASQDSGSSYYGGLHEALAEARNQIGIDLTIWRDAVGKLELSKESKKGNMDEEEESDGEGDEE
ncbi:hypothetical protein GGU10DRAFT_383081 [Lentinula aff. detonsa]|uniref:Uncharacterized protein n=1 Tax=Lentinula aff. detonsa TaxID=2804958 RepID=A0AA38U7K7_9AGAR|nr:hypothetical protein GGU10DRAFT_383081 [Lentinula aff. detonsa]